MPATFAQRTYLELRCIWTILTEGRKGYSRHPETLHWRGKLKALYLRHDALVTEMGKRGYRHKTLLDKRLSKGSRVQNVLIHTKQEQIQILKQKKCYCGAT